MDLFTGCTFLNVCPCTYFSSLLSPKNKIFRLHNSRYNSVRLSRDKLGYILVMKGQQLGYPQFNPTQPIYEALRNIVFPTLSKGIKMYVILDLDSDPNICIPSPLVIHCLDEFLPLAVFANFLNLITNLKSVRAYLIRSVKRTDTFLRF